MKLVLIGDGESPHLLKWARALALRVDLYAVSSRRFLPAFRSVMPDSRCLALGTRPSTAGGNVGLVASAPRVAAWLRRIRPDWVHAHYLTSHGTLAWLATRVLRAPGRLVGSAWGSDILVTPAQSAAMRWVTRRVLAACEVTTSDSRHMAQRMLALGARDVLTFPFGLESLPEMTGEKDDRLFFANRALEPLYAPERTLAVFAGIAAQWPDARLVVANDGSMRHELEAQAARWGERVHFVGRLDAVEQAFWYRSARWYLSLPRSDSVSVSVLEAMAHGCIPVLSDLPANRELVDDGRSGLIVAQGVPDRAALEALLPRADAIGVANHEWVRANAMFGPCVERFVEHLRER